MARDGVLLQLREVRGNVGNRLPAVNRSVDRRPLVVRTTNRLRPSLRRELPWTLRFVGRSSLRRPWLALTNISSARQNLPPGLLPGILYCYLFFLNALGDNQPWAKKYKK